MATPSEAFLDEVNAAHSMLRVDAEAWREELKERELWDSLLCDGFDEE